MAWSAQAQPITAPRSGGDDSKAGSVSYPGGNDATNPLQPTIIDAPPSLAPTPDGFTTIPPVPLKHQFPQRGTAQPLLRAQGTPAMRPAPVPRRRAPVASFDTINFDENGTANGSFSIPPDPSGTVGNTHVLAVGNTSIEAFTKTGGAVAGFGTSSLKTFFTSITNTFDPKAIYDHFTNRFLVVTLEFEGRGDADATNDAAKIYVAASPVNAVTPTANWNAVTIDAKLTLTGDNSWCDYPGFGVDEEAIYITCNYFTFSNSTFKETRLVIIDKSTLYGGGAVTSSIVDPIPGGFFDGTHQVSKLYADPNPGGTFGTWLISAGGLNNGAAALAQVIKVTDPLGTPTFSGEFINLGAICTGVTCSSPPDAPQSGSGTLVLTNDARALDAVWRDNSLWMVNTINPTGAESGQATARWTRFGATAAGATTLTASGTFGGEGIGAGTYTFFPSIAVNATCAMVGFAASSGAIFPGFYYGKVDVATNTTGIATLAKAGAASYVRTFGGSNRWGDYSSTALDPSDDSFWMFHQYAMSQGTAFGGENGRWAQFAANETCANTTLPVELTDFTGVRDGQDVVLNWTTASELNNSGFQIEQANATGTFEAITFVEGAGTTVIPQQYSHRLLDLPSGTYRFRLKQIDYDGTSEYSPEIELLVTLPGQSYTLSAAYPNPFVSTTQVDLRVESTQAIRAQLFSILGQAVRDVYTGVIEANEPHTLTVDATGLPSGIYFLHIEGEAFTAKSSALTFIR
ncbi:MAG: hypothetical protein RhofKO_25180 [Rhodothermales bacterium]